MSYSVPAAAAAKWRMRHSLFHLRRRQRRWKYFHFSRSYLIMVLWRSYSGLRKTNNTSSPLINVCWRSRSFSLRLQVFIYLRLQKWQCRSSYICIMTHYDSSMFVDWEVEEQQIQKRGKLSETISFRTLILFLLTTLSLSAIFFLDFSFDCNFTPWMLFSAT